MGEMTKKPTVPAIRFKGFTDTWEQRKLGELGTITTGSTPSTAIPDYYSDDGIVWVTPTDICENITFESARKLSDLGQQVGRVVPKNTILVTCIASIGKNTMLGNAGSFNQQINGLTPNENECDPYFLLTESALWSAKMKSSAAAGTMQIVNRTEFSELKTWLPSLIEQQAISDFFRQLDNLITLHQRKLDKLHKVKRSLLERMFPRNGANVPEIRFSGFTDAWEQCELGAIIQAVQELTSDFENYPLYSLTIENGVTPKTERYERSFLITKETDLFKIVPEQCFVSNPMNLRFGAIGFNDSGKKVSVSGYYDVFSIDRGECSNFWCVYLKTANSLKRFDDVAIGSLIEKRRVHFSQLTEMSFPAPNMNEKKKLGEFFERLERLITLHQRKLDKLRQIKRSMLEKMFV
ncbi:MAG TPA: restriction endonuclease subunit S [Ruminococcus sp.]|nr:restriction endonuclease subunit S [Ruminococcus sp.]